MKHKKWLAAVLAAAMVFSGGGPGSAFAAGLVQESAEAVEESSAAEAEVNTTEEAVEPEAAETEETAAVAAEAEETAAVEAKEPAAAQDVADEAAELDEGVLTDVDVSAGETVYMSFIPERDGIYVFTSAAEEDTYGYLYDENMGEITYNDDGGKGNNFRIEYELTAGITYHLGVRFYDSDYLGTIPVIVFENDEISLTIKKNPEDEGNVLTVNSTESYTLYDGYLLPEFADESTDFSLSLEAGQELLGFSLTGEAQEIDYSIGDTIRFTEDTILYAIAEDIQMDTLSMGDNEVFLEGTEKQYYQFTPEEDGLYLIYSTLENYDYVPCITLYESIDFDNSELDSNSYGGFYYNFRLSYPLSAGSTYYIVLYDEYGNEGTINVHAAKAVSLQFMQGENSLGSVVVEPGEMVTISQNYVRSDYMSPYSFTMPSIEDEYMLAGWSTSADAAEAEYLNGQAFSITEDTILYPVFQKVEIQTMQLGNNTSVLEAGDAAYYAFTPEESGTYLFYCTGDVNAQTYLYESPNFGGEYITSGSDWYNYGIAQMSADMEAGKTYYLSAQYYEPEDSGTLTVVAAKGCSVTLVFSYSAAVSVIYGDTMTFSPNGFILSNGTSHGYTFEAPEYGYRLAGWSRTEGAESAEFRIGESLTITEDTTLYAVYEPIPYEILQIGANRMEVNGQDYTYTKYTPEESGDYVFYSEASSNVDAWLYSVDNNSEFYLEGDDDSGIDYNFRLEYYLDAGTTYVLKVQCSYQNESCMADIHVSKASKVTFSDGENEISSVLLADGETIIFDSTDIIRTSLRSMSIDLYVDSPAGYRCVGWSGTQGAASAEYKAGDEVSFTEDTILYPVFEEITYQDLTGDATRLHWAEEETEYMQFTPAEDGEYIFYSTGANGYDNSFSLYTSKDTSAGGVDITTYETYEDDFRFTAQLEAGHTYYLHVNMDDSYSGVFRVWVKKAVHLNLYSGIAEKPEVTIPVYPGEEITFYESSIEYQYAGEASTEAVMNKLPKRSTMKGWARTADAQEADYVSSEKLTVRSDTDLYAVYLAAEEADILPLQIGENDLPTASRYFVASFTPEKDGSYILSSGNMACNEDEVILYDDSSLTDPLEYATLNEDDSFRLACELKKGTTYYIEVSADYFYEGSTPFITVAEGIVMTLKLGSESADYILQPGEEISFGRDNFVTVQNGWYYGYTFSEAEKGKYLIGWSLTEGAKTPDYAIGSTASFEDNTVLYAVLEDMTASLAFTDGKAEAVLAAGETAYIRLEVPQDGLYTIYTQQEEDTYGYLYDENWKELERDDDDGIDTNFQISRRLSKGTYYVGVRYYSSSRTGTITVYAGKAQSIVFRGVENRYSTCTVAEGTRITITDTGYLIGEYSYDLSYLVGVVEELKGWSLTNGAAEANYISGSTITCTEDMTLYTVTKARTLTTFREGENAFTSVFGGTVYGSFTPDESGTYLLYSATNGNEESSCPVWASVYFAEESIASDIYSGYGNEFRFSADLKAGETYYIVLKDERYDGYTTQKDISKSLNICKAVKLTLMGEDNVTRTYTALAGEKLYAGENYIRLEKADSVSLNLYCPDNMILAGWSTTKDAAQVTLPVGGEMTINGDTTLYAVWENINYRDAVLGENQVSISNDEKVYMRFTPDSDGNYVFYTDGADASISCDLYAFGNDQEEPLSDSSNKNYNLRFRASLDGGKTYYITLSADEDKSQNISLWISHAYELKFRGDGITEGTEYAGDGEKIYFTNTGIRSEYMHNQELVRRSDAALAGWTTVRGGTSVQYAVGEEALFTADTRLYPVWKEITFTELHLGNNTLSSGEGMLSWGSFTPDQDGLYLFGLSNSAVYNRLAEDKAFQNYVDPFAAGYGNGYGGSRFVYNLKAGQTYYYRQRGTETSPDEAILKISYQPVRLALDGFSYYGVPSSITYVDSNEKVTFVKETPRKIRLMIDNEHYTSLYCYDENLPDSDLIGFSRTQNATRAEYTFNKAYTFTADTTLYPVYGTAQLEKIELEQTSAELVTFNKEADNSAKSKLQLKVIFTPENAANQNVTWKSSNPAVAEVDENGLVTAKTYGQATITATAEDGGLTATCKIQTRYYDVCGSPDKNNANYEYWFTPVYWAADKNITKGYDNIYFGPEEKCKREQMITFLYREAGSPAVSGSDIKKYNTFSDVPGNAYYTKAVVWAAKKGITKGYSSGPNKGKFGVGFDVTREDTVTFIYRMAGKPKYNTTKSFTDVKKGAYYYDAVLWAAQKGITNGYSSGPNKGKFGVGFNVLRKDIVTFLYRYAGSK